MSGRFKAMSHERDGRSSGTEDGRRLLEIRLDSFGWQTLEAAAGRQDESIEELVAAACGHLVIESERGRAAARLLRLPGPREAEARELELVLPARIWHALEVEAEEQNAELPRVIEHASLLHISDLESGRGARLILDEPPGEAQQPDPGCGEAQQPDPG